MQYTVWSGNRQIGVTDLGFRYRRGGSRTGWFFPIAANEDLMPKIVDPLIGNYMGRTHGTSAGPLSRDEHARLAEYEEACRRAAAWDLRVRREDGSLVPTESVGIRDVEALLACYPDELFEESLEDELESEYDFDDGDPSEAWRRGRHDIDDEANALFVRDIENDLLPGDEWLDERLDNSDWAPDDDTPLPRYQIFVLLSDPSAVP